MKARLIFEQNEKLHGDLKYRLTVYCVENEKGNKIVPAIWQSLVENNIKEYISVLQPNVAFDEDTILQFETEEKGKPYIKNLDIQFNISHSRNMLAILISNYPCGIDIQKKVNCKYNEITKRFFSKEEAKSVENGGIEEFFRIWTKKEAFGKTTGKGFFEKEDFDKNIALKEIVFENEELKEYFCTIGFGL